MAKEDARLAGDVRSPNDADRPREPSRRLFFALWPDEEQRSAFAHATRKAVRASGGRPVPTESLHVTLAFLGSVPERRIADLTPIARRVAETFTAGGPALRLQFDRLEHWKKPQILCALGGEAAAGAVAPGDFAAPQIAALSDALKAGTAGAGFAPDLKPFRAHVTVARKVVRPTRPLQMHPVLWSFSGFALVESRTKEEGAVYSVIASFALFSEQKV